MSAAAAAASATGFKSGGGPGGGGARGGIVHLPRWVDPVKGGTETARSEFLAKTLLGDGSSPLVAAEVAQELAGTVRVEAAARWLHCPPKTLVEQFSAVGAHIVHS